MKKAPRWLPAALIGAGLGLVLRFALFFVGTLLVGPLAALAGQLLALLPSVDPVYTRAALRSLSDVRVQGLAVAGPLGDALHALAPGLVVESARCGGTLARLAVEPGSPLLGRLVATTFAHVGVLAIGLLLVRAGLVRQRLPLTAAGIAIQAQVALGILGAPPSLAELEATGISFAVNVLLPSLTGRRVALSDLLVAAPPPLVTAGLVALALLVAYAPAGALAALALAGRRRTSPPPAGRRQAVPMATVRRHQRAMRTAAVLALAIVFASATLGAAVPPTLALDNRARPPADAPDSPAAPGPSPFAVAAEPTPEPAPPATPTPTPGAAYFGRPDDWFRGWRADVARPPSHVELQGRDYQFELRVNGQPEVIRGMGLNTQYQRLLSPGERTARLEADLTAFSNLGVNTIIGWDPAEFEDPLLDLADARGIGVVLPFDLDPDADYTDPAYRAELTERVMAWVERYRAHPALRMWGLGNEVLHKIVHPAWVGPQDPARARNARAFAAWLVATADAIHDADPDHPVTYRDAEDAFTGWLVEALRAGGPRPWFAFGTNVYTNRLKDVVDGWPDRGMGVALWVSEFAPSGLAIPDRPEGFRKMWGWIRAHPDWVLGGAVYAWTRDGPEEIDRTIGLTDDGKPVDGRSLETLAELFHPEP